LERDSQPLLQAGSFSPFPLVHFPPCRRGVLQCGPNLFFLSISNGGSLHRRYGQGCFLFGANNPPGLRPIGRTRVYGRYLFPLYTRPSFPLPVYKCGRRPDRGLTMSPLINNSWSAPLFPRRQADRIPSIGLPCAPQRSSPRINWQVRPLVVSVESPPRPQASTVNRPVPPHVFRNATCSPARLGRVEAPDTRSAFLRSPLFLPAAPARRTQRAFQSFSVRIPLSACDTTREF